MVVAVEKLAERELIVPVRFSRREIDAMDRAVQRLGSRSRSALIRDPRKNSFEKRVGSK